MPPGLFGGDGGMDLAALRGLTERTAGMAVYLLACPAKK